MKLRSNSWRKTFIGLVEEYFFAGSNKKSWRDRAGIAENRYQEGNGRINIFKDVAIILGIGGIMGGIDFSFIPFKAFIVIAILWVWGCYTIGYFSEKFGWWKNRANHLSGIIDPNISEILETIRKIKEKLNIN